MSITRLEPMRYNLAMKWIWDIRQPAHGIVAGIFIGAGAYLFDRLCELSQRSEYRYAEAFCDGAAHVATAVATSLPVASFVGNPGRFLMTAATSAVVIDLDHVVVARSVELIPCMSMPVRPASHSLLTIGMVAYVAERLWPGTQSELGIALGLASHLVRDIATGGAPLFIPRRIVETARPRATLMLLSLAAGGRWYARHMLNPVRPRRSNPTVLAPEVLIASSRAVRAARAASRAA